MSAPTRVGPDLETIGVFDFNGRLRGAMTAHPHLDPRTGGTAGDDGWLPSLVHDETCPKTDLMTLDARGMTETARVHMPRRIPYGFHANWLPDELA